MGYSLLAKKPMSLMLEESRETGEHSLKRTLGPVSLTARRRRDHRRGDFRALGPRRALRRSGPDAFVRDLWIRLRLRGPLLRGIFGHDSAGGQRLHLCLRGTRRTLRVDHWLGSNAGIRHGREHSF